MLLCLVKISSVGVNMEMPHWLSAIICNAVCRLRRDLKNWQPETQMGNPRNYSFQLTTNSGILSSVCSEPEAQASVWQPRHAHPASFTGHFTAIFYAHGRIINVEISSWKMCSGPLFLGGIWKIDLVRSLWDGPHWTVCEDMAAPLLTLVCVFLGVFVYLF